MITPPDHTMTCTYLARESSFLLYNLTVPWQPHSVLYLMRQNKGSDTEWLCKSKLVKKKLYYIQQNPEFLNHQGEWKLVGKSGDLTTLEYIHPQRPRSSQWGWGKVKTTGKTLERESCAKVFPIVWTFPLPYWLPLGVQGLGKSILLRLFCQGNDIGSNNWEVWKVDSWKIRIPLYERVVKPFKPSCVIGLGA